MTSTRRRWPAWLPLRRVLTLGVVATVAGGAIATLHVHSHRGFLRQVEGALALSAALSADAVHDWVTMRAAQAALVARVAEDSVAPRPVPMRDVAAPLQLMVSQGGFRAAALVDSTGTPPRLRTRLVDDSLTVIEFAAPVRRAGLTQRWVVLTAVANEAAFSHFNVATASDRTQRTSLVAVEPGGVRVLTSSAAGGAAQPARAGASIPRELRLDETYRRDVMAAGLAPSHGIGPGLYGRPVVYARAPVPGTPWLLVRERDVAELSALIMPSLLFTDAVFGVLALLSLGVVLMLWRAAHLRREHEATLLRSTFVSSVSHELRTPLTQIRMYAEMLRLGLLGAPGDAARALGVIEKEAERLSMLVERSLSFVRTGQDTVPEQETVVDVQEAVRSALAVVAPLAAERQQTVCTSDVADVTARIGRDGMQQVLLNLLDNAIKYGPDGQTIRISSERVDRHTRIVVDDEGPGVPRDERDVIWEPFARGRTAQAGMESGSGIGLAVVHDLVTRAGGRVFVEPRPPRDGAGAAARGARFVVELPSAA